MSNDIYQQRQFFEPDKRFKLSNGWEFKGTTLSFDKDKVERVSMKGLTAEELEKRRHFMFCIDKDCKICKDAGLRDRTIFSDKEIEDIKEKFPNLSDYEYLKLLNK